MILVFLVPQQLKATHEQSVDKTVAQMNQLVLAARNYYMATRPTAANNASAWPTTLNQLVSGSYLPQAALCSTWPKGDSSLQSNANNKGADCNSSNHQEYALFPANSAGNYDTTVPGIAANGNNSGGNFWGVSLALPNAKVAAEVRDRLPFATICPPSELSKTSTTCGKNSNIVTALVPRPANFPGLTAPAPYSKDGLIQSIGTVRVCDGDCKPKNTIMTATISTPNTCNSNTTTPVLFVYPFDFSAAIPNPPPSNGAPYYYSGIKLFTTRNNDSWTVSASTDEYTLGKLYLAYFTTCAPTNVKNSNTDPYLWDASSFTAGNT